MVPLLTFLLFNHFMNLLCKNNVFFSGIREYIRLNKVRLKEFRNAFIEKIGTLGLQDTFLDGFSSTITLSSLS